MAPRVIKCVLLGLVAFAFWTAFWYQAANDPLLWLTPNHYSVGVEAR